MQCWQWGCLALIVFFSPACFPRVSAADWPQWRGPFFNGSTSETNLPTTWSRQDGIRWTTPLPGRSGSTPVVAGGRIFLTAPNENQELLLSCLDARTGAVLWSRTVTKGDREIGKNNMASCSPVTDGTNVYALFGTGDLAAFDFSGEPLWQRRLTEDYGTFSVLFLYGASPLLHSGRLYIPLLQRNPPVYGHVKDAKPDRQSFLICVDAASGQTLWAAERKSAAPEEAMEAYTTPIPFASATGTRIVLAGADAVTAHSADTGQEVWRFSGLNVRKNPGGRIVPSPVALPGLVFACGPKREVLVALKADETPLPDSERVRWKNAQYVPDVCTPLLYSGKLFVLDGDRQMLTCYQPETGEKLWQGRLGVREIFYASPTGADGKIYCLSEEGTAVVVSAGDAFEVLSTVAMGESPCRSSIIAADQCVFLRTARNLYCVSSAKP